MWICFFEHVYYVSIVHSKSWLIRIQFDRWIHPNWAKVWNLCKKHLRKHFFQDWCYLDSRILVKITLIQQNNNPINITILFKWNKFIHTVRLYVFTLTYQIKKSVIVSANVPCSWIPKGTATHLTLKYMLMNTQRHCNTSNLAHWLYPKCIGQQRWQLTVTSCGGSSNGVL